MSKFDNIERVDHLLLSTCVDGVPLTKVSYFQPNFNDRLNKFKLSIITFFRLENDFYFFLFPSLQTRTVGRLCHR